MRRHANLIMMNAMKIAIKMRDIGAEKQKKGQAQRIRFTRNVSVLVRELRISMNSRGKSLYDFQDLVLLTREKLEIW